MATSTAPKTFISVLRPSRAASLEATVARLERVREVEQRLGGTTRVRNRILTDGTGEPSLVLWGKDVDLVAEDQVRITEG